MRPRLAETKLFSRRGNKADNSISIGGSASSRRRLREGGFTLVEVVLAIGLAIVILVVAMSFYHQATNLRGQLIEASERVSTIRLLMDRLASDLRSARSHDWEGFNGDATSLRFVKCEAIASSAWTRSQPATDLRLVTYGVSTGLDGTNTTVTGFNRTERSALEMREPRGAASSLGASSSAATAAVYTNVASVEPLTDVIRFVHFRYWDGTTWVESWGDVVPPLAVEVSFGFDPQPDDALPDEYPFEVFRRIVALPGGRESDPFAELFAVESSGSKSKSTEGTP
jgi:type II secretory pathway pseudopilin PulG